MKSYLFAAAWLLISLSSCKQQDDFTGLWNKNANAEWDGKAFPSWEGKGSTMVNRTRVKSPVFIRIKKEMNYYVMNCYQLDASRHQVVADPSIFDYVKLKKVDEHTLISDNQASNIITATQIIVQVQPGTGEMTMKFGIPDTDMPAEPRANALFHTLFSSGYHKLMEIRRKTEDADLVDSKLKSEGLVK